MFSCTPIKFIDCCNITLGLSYASGNNMVTCQVLFSIFTFILCRTFFWKNLDSFWKCRQPHPETCRLSGHLKRVCTVCVNQRLARNKYFVEISLVLVDQSFETLFRNGETCTRFSLTRFLKNETEVSFSLSGNVVQCFSGSLPISAWFELWTDFAKFWQKCFTFRT